MVALYAGVNGHLDDIPTPQVQQFQDELREHMRTEGSIYKQIRETGELSDDVVQMLEAELEKFKKSFNIRDEGSLA